MPKSAIAPVLPVRFVRKRALFSRRCSACSRWYSRTPSRSFSISASTACSPALTRACSNPAADQPLHDFCSLRAPNGRCRGELRVEVAVCLRGVFGSKPRSHEARRRTGGAGGKGIRRSARLEGRWVWVSGSVRCGFRRLNRQRAGPLHPLGALRGTLRLATPSCSPSSCWPCFGCAACGFPPLRAP